MPAFWATGRGISFPDTPQRPCRKTTPKSYLSLCCHCCSRYLPFLTLKNALRFCQWDCSLRSNRFFSLLAVRDVLRERRERLRREGPRRRGAKRDGWRLYSRATWSRDTDNFVLRFVPPVIFPQLSHITTKFYLNILYFSNFILAIWRLTLICFLYRYWWMYYWDAQMYCTWHMQ